MALSDILYRVLTASGYKVKSVRNITDIDDKIVKKAAKKGLPIDEFSEEYSKVFFEDLKKLNILDVDANPRATRYIEQMIKYNKDLIEKGLAYEKDGSVYFDISKFKGYGKLSRIDKRQLKTGTRVLSDEYTKENVQDFALWKAVKQNEVGYSSPWGRGRPGWHIECSVMSQGLLGETFDIHVGGIDLLFPHHENEIAQSEGKTGKKFVNYFVHGEHMLVDGKKMSKSLNNFYTTKDIEEKGFDPLALRYLYLTAHYKDPLNFTWESLGSAQNALNKLRSQISSAKDQKSRTTLSPEKQVKLDVFRKKFLAAINDNLNTPQAIAVLWEMMKSNLPSKDKYDLALFFDEVLGLKLAEPMAAERQPTAEVKKLVEEREKLRSEGKFKEADKVRKKIQDLGFVVKDTKQGPEVKSAQNAQT
jgi:cysteinyl-tRNA synthetase